jgi:DNA-directed RNA polymerases I, II, and III subunit RPABC2
MPEEIKLKELDEIEPVLSKNEDDEPMMLSDGGSVDGNSDDDFDDDEESEQDNEEDEESEQDNEEDFDDDNVAGANEGESMDDTGISQQEINSDDEADEVDEHQKIDRAHIDQYIIDNHPESIIHNKEEIEALSKVFRNKEGDIEDQFHKTIPIITRFEKAKILGLRARQLNKAPEQAFVKVDLSIIDGYKIALEEYKQKKIPFIIKRPLPDGSCEYWKFEDLEQLE